MRSAICAFSAFMLFGASAMAQAPAGGPGPLTRLAGAVKSVSGDRLTVVSDKGESIEVVVPPTAQLAQPAEASRAELAAATFVNCVAPAGAAGVLPATECSIISPTARAINTGHFAQGATTRTVGKVASTSGDPSTGLELVVAYNDGQQRIAVSSSTKVSKPAPLTLGEIKPGYKVVAATQVVDGKPTVFSLVVASK